VRLGRLRIAAIREGFYSSISKVSLSKVLPPRRVDLTRDVQKGGTQMLNLQQGTDILIEVGGITSIKDARALFEEKLDAGHRVVQAGRGHGHHRLARGQGEDPPNEHRQGRREVAGDAGSHDSLRPARRARAHRRPHVLHRQRRRRDQRPGQEDSPRRGAEIRQGAHGRHHEGQDHDRRLLQPRPGRRQARVPGAGDHVLDLRDAQRRYSLPPRLRELRRAGEKVRAVPDQPAQ